jgi:tripartite-type tricarboxylate transporter receptor subunit TctC
MQRENKLAIIIASFVLLLSLLTWMSLTGPEAYAQGFPSRPIKIVLPFGPGGVNNVIWRTLSDRMSKVLGQPVLIENKPGGGTTLAFTLIARSKPDGYTTGTAPVPSVTNTYLAYKVDYEPIKSFTRIGGCWRYNEVLAVKADSRWKNWNEFYEYAKKNPNEVKVGFSNPIGSVVGTMKLIARRNRLEWREVITTGEAELVSQLLGDHISAFVGAGVVHTLFKDGRARPILAITNDKMPDYPEVPTAYELYGINSLNVAGLIGPAGIPDAIVKKLEAALHEATQSPEYQKTIEQMGAVVRWRSSKEFEEDFKMIFTAQKENLKELGLIREELK